MGLLELVQFANGLQELWISTVVIEMVKRLDSPDREYWRRAGAIVEGRRRNHDSFAFQLPLVAIFLGSQVLWWSGRRIGRGFHW
jgi:hypothetical protein